MAKEMLTGSDYKQQTSRQAMVIEWKIWMKIEKWMVH